MSFIAAVRVRRLTKEIFLYLFVLFAILHSFPTLSLASEKVTLQLRWDYQFQFAGYIAADWMGYYEDEGLTVDIRSAIKPDKTILSAIKEVEAGRAQFGVGGADILIARDKGAPLVVLASIFQHSAAAFYTLKETPISSLADFTRLKVARRVNDLIDVELQAMLRAEGIDPKLVNPHKHQPGYAHLLNGDVDILPGYSISFPFEVEVAKVDIATVTPIQYGIGFYGDSLFTTEEMIETSPELVQRFIRASLKGWEYALAHPEEIADRISTELPRTADLVDVKGFNRFQIKGVTDLALYPIVKTGHINPERWGLMHQYLQESDLVSNPLDLNTFIYAPQKLNEERDLLVWNTLVGAALFLGLITISSIVWVRLLRRTVARKTESLCLEVQSHRETEKNLAESSELLRSIFEQAAVGMAQLQLDGHWLKVNQRLCDIVGYTYDEMMDLTFQDITHPDDLETDLAFVQELIDGKRQHYSMQKRYFHKTGSTIWINLTGSVVRDENNNPEYFIAIIEDVTERKQAQEDLKTSEKRLALAHRLESVGQLASGIAHEINTPLQYIQGNLEFMSKSYSELEAALSVNTDFSSRPEMELIHEHKAAIHDSADGVNRISQIVQAMKKLAHPGVNSITTIDLNELIKNVVIIATNEWRYVAEIEMDLDDSPFLFTCNPGEINQVMLNLLVNAAHAIAEKVEGTSNKGHITISAHPTDEDVIITINDDGCGIHENDQHRVYDPFFTTKEIGKGTGQGMSIAHTIIERHGGTITLNSQKDIGTTFTVRFPLR